MKRFYISRGRYEVETAYIDAETEEEALQKADEDWSIDWDKCDNDEEPLIQIEDVKDI